MDVSQIANPAQAGLGQASASPFPQLQMAHDVASARLDKLDAAGALLGKVRAELDSLVKMGDTVSQDDVIKASGKLVAAGLAPMAVAGLLADMPQQGGEALQGWVRQHDLDVRQRETQLQQVHAQARHAAGLAGLQLLAGHSMLDHVAQGPPQIQQPQQNPLTPDSGQANDLGTEIPGRASGGPVAPGQPYVVGEDGPELMVPQAPGTVVPNFGPDRDQFGRRLMPPGVLAGGGDPTRPAAPVDPVTQALQQQLEAEIAKSGGIAGVLKRLEQNKNLPRM